MNEQERERAIEGQLMGIKGAQVWKCLNCIGEYNIAIQKYPGAGKPPINDAITLAPTWQNTTLMGQTFFACVAVPTCMDHLTTQEKTPQQKAMEGGLILGGPGN